MTALYVTVSVLISVIASFVVSFSISTKNFKLMQYSGLVSLLSFAWPVVLLAVPAVPVFLLHKWLDQNVWPVVVKIYKVWKEI